MEKSPLCKNNLQTKDKEKHKSRPEKGGKGQK